jgi:predicted ATPase
LGRVAGGGTWLGGRTPLGQLAESPRVASLCRYIEGWFLSNFLPDLARQVPEAGAKEHLSRTGGSLANVVHYLAEEHPGILESILDRVASRIPGLQKAEPKRALDSWLVLRFKDGPFEHPFLAKFVSDGTIRMFAYLVLLSDPDPLLCIEESENGLHPRLLLFLAGEVLKSIAAASAIAPHMDPERKISHSFRGSSQAIVRAIGEPEVQR